jgi:dihydroflavonol-4-reductase
MTILVTGVTGFVGGAITAQLIANGESVRALVRPGARPTRPALLEQVEVAEGDLLDPPSLERAMEGVSRVFHAGGIISFDRERAENTYRANTEGAVNVFAAAQQAGVRRVVYTASIFALGHTPDPDDPVTEEHTFNAHDLLDIPYVRAKHDAEIAAQQFIERGLNLVRLYPGLCMGPGDVRRSSTAMIDYWLQGRLPAIITGGGIPIIDVRDAAQAHLAAMERGTPGRRYIASGFNLTLEELFTALAQHTNQPPPAFKLGSGLGVPLAQFSSKLGLLRAVDPDQARLMTRYWFFSNRRAIGELGVRFRQLEGTLSDTIDWLQRNRIYATSAR